MCINVSLAFVRSVPFFRSTKLFRRKNMPQILITRSLQQRLSTNIYSVYTLSTKQTTQFCGKYIA